MDLLSLQSLRCLHALEAHQAGSKCCMHSHGSRDKVPASMAACVVFATSAARHSCGLIPLPQKGGAVQGARRAMGAVGGAISSAAAAVTPARFKTSKSAAELAMGDSEGCES